MANHSDTTDVLIVIKDSLTRIAHHIQELAQNSSPEPYTVQSIDLAENNLYITEIATVIGFLGLIAGIVGTYYGFKAYYFAKQTAVNVVRMSPRTQVALYKDFIKDLYGNTAVLLRLMKKIKDGEIISQSNLIALYIADFNDIFHFEAYNQDEKMYLEMKYIKTRMRNYNDTVLLCCNDAEKGKLTQNELSKLLFKTVHILTLTRLSMMKIEISQSHDNILMFIINKLHIRHMINNKDYISSRWKAEEFHEQIREYAMCLSSNEKSLEKLYTIIDGVEFINYAYDAVEYIDFIKHNSTDDEYKSLMLKRKWTAADVRALLVKVLSYDALLLER